VLDATGFEVSNIYLMVHSHGTSFYGGTYNSRERVQEILSEVYEHIGNNCPFPYKMPER
jgi:hypothetical protein